MVGDGIGPIKSGRDQSVGRLEQYVPRGHPPRRYPGNLFLGYRRGDGGNSITEIKGLRRETAEREFFDAGSQSKAAQLEQIKNPAFVCASWSDQGLSPTEQAPSAARYEPKQPVL